MKRVLLIGLTLAMLVATGCYGPPVAREELRREEHSIPLGDVESVEVRLKFGAGRLEVSAGAEGLFSGEFAYNLDRLKPEIEYSESEGLGRLSIKQEARGLLWPFRPKVHNKWALRFSDQVPLRLDVDAGACEGKFDLGGLRLTDLRIGAGASRLRIEFDRPNPERLRRIDINAGAADLALEGLGNANFEELRFDGGAGNFTLDFGGQWRRSAEVDIDAGACSITIRVPKELGAKVVVGKSPLSSATLEGFRRSDRGYVNESFGQSEHELVVNLDMGVGSLTLISE